MTMLTSGLCEAALVNMDAPLSLAYSSPWQGADLGPSMYQTPDLNPVPKTCAFLGGATDAGRFTVAGTPGGEDAFPVYPGQEIGQAATRTRTDAEVPAVAVGEAGTATAVPAPVAIAADDPVGDERGAASARHVLSEILSDYARTG